MTVGAAGGRSRSPPTARAWWPSSRSRRPEDRPDSARTTSAAAGPRGTMDISCAFAPSLDTPEHIALAESLGYRRAWCYDSPALYPDVWMVLARAADRTDTIGLGTAVIVPSLRHPMVNAAAIAALSGWAPGRVAVAIGSGYTGRMVLGQRPMKWADVAAYVRTVQALLRGEEVEWEGRPLRMLHDPSVAPARPVEVPWLIGADGPKGLAVASELGDGLF